MNLGMTEKEKLIFFRLDPEAGFLIGFTFFLSNTDSSISRGRGCMPLGLTWWWRANYIRKTLKLLVEIHPSFFSPLIILSFSPYKIQMHGTVSFKPATKDLRSVNDWTKYGFIFCTAPANYPNIYFFLKTSEVEIQEWTRTKVQSGPLVSRSSIGAGLVSDFFTVWLSVSKLFIQTRPKGLIRSGNISSSESLMLMCYLNQCWT